MAIEYRCHGAALNWESSSIRRPWRGAWILAAFALVGCHRPSNRYAYGPGYYPQQQWAPAPDAVYDAYRPPPPRIPPNLTPQAQLVQALGDAVVRYGFVGPGGCLPGFSKSASGACVLAPTLLPDLSKVLFPGLAPSQAQTSAPASEKPQVTHATVLVESALLNATKFDGRCWDLGCNERQSREVAKAASDAAAAIVVATTTVTAATAAPFAAAFAVLAPIAAKTTSHPDASGWAYVITRGTFSEPGELKIRRDTLTPQWGLHFDHVPIVEGTYVRLELVDADPDIPFTNGNDDMGIINIGVDELVKAMQARETYQVNVQRQTHEQVLFVGISVLPE
jgi:hypothetical protein